MHVPRLVSHHHTALALHEQSRWSARITVTALAVGGILMVRRSRPTVQAHCSGVETNVCALRLACDTRREMGSRLMLSVRLEGSRLMLSVMTHAAHDSVLRWQRSQRIWLRHGESEPFRAHWQASLVTSSDFVGCERDFVGVNVTS